MALAGALMLAGCGKPPTDTQPGADVSTAPAAPSEAEPPPAAAEPDLVVATNETLSGGAEFTRKSLASPFAQAGQALKESYDAALIAYQIGDYARAASDLRLLAKTPGLTPEQERAVQDLLAQTLKAAPELVTSPGADAADGSMPDTPELPVAVPGTTDSSPTGATNETRPGGAEFTRKSLASPFAQAGQALRESYDSALVAIQIGDYDRAVDELKVLAQNPDLTAEQTQAVRDLMAQTVKAAPSPGAAPADGATPATPR